MIGTITCENRDVPIHDVIYLIRELSSARAFTTKGFKIEGIPATQLIEGNQIETLRMSLLGT